MLKLTVFLIFFAATGVTHALEVIIPTQPSIVNYVGEQKCKTCHPKEWRKWKSTKHAFAYTTLGENDKKRPECLRCHVSGFEETMGRANSHFLNVQCEACHGPGTNHIKTQTKETITGIKSNCDCQIRIVCMGCHNKKHSPGFKLGEFWGKIKH